MDSALLNVAFGFFLCWVFLSYRQQQIVAQQPPSNPFEDIFGIINGRF